MRIAFCTTCKGRAQHLKITLPRNLADNASYADAVFVVLDYGSDDDLRTYLGTHHAADIASGRLVVYSLQRAGTFQMAHAKNLAHRCGILEGADILVNLDADNYTGLGFAQYLALQFELHGQHSFQAVGRTIPGVTPRGVSGRIVVTTGAFLNAGGYDERFDVWSPDDKDFNHRLRRLGYQWQQIPDRFLDCVRHNDRMRFREYRHAAMNDVHSHEAAVSESTTRIVNWGCIGQGSLFRNWHVGPIRFEPVPTHVFGIGLHKTGTTSLHHALTALKLDSAHWPSAHWARAIWEEMRAQGHSPTLERHYATCDLPMPLLYKELDTAYPGSRFILTTRDEGEWLESVRKHWDPEHNMYRHQWDTDPFTHRVHLELYGRRRFDPDVMLARYRAHNDAVRQYFVGRPADLLELPLTDHMRWEPLCDFLNKPVPLLPYPKANEAMP